MISRIDLEAWIWVEEDEIGEVRGGPAHLLVLRRDLHSLVDGHHSKTFCGTIAVSKLNMAGVDMAGVDMALGLSHDMQVRTCQELWVVLEASLR